MKKAMWLTVLGFCGALMVLSTFSLATAQDPARVGSTSAPSLLSKPVAERTLEATAQPTREAVFLGTFPSSPTEGTPTPEPVGAQADILPAEPRPVPEGQTVPHKEGLNTAGQIWVWTDRGCGSSTVYYPGDYITFYFEAAQSGSATLYYHTSSGSYIVWSGYMNANVTYYIPTQIDSSAQGGVRILRILMPSVLAQDYCGFTIQCGGNVGAIYVWTNKGQYGCGGVYNRNEPITIYIQAEQYGDAWLFDYWSDGQVQQIYLGYLQADVTYYIQSTVNEPGGQQVLRAIMPDAYAQDYCSFIVQGAPPTPTRTPTATPTSARDFTVSATPSLPSVCVDGGSFYTVTVTGLNGFNSQVSLSVDGLPPNTYWFENGNQISPGTAKRLQICPQNSMSPGSYTIDVVGTSGTIQRSTMTPLNIIAHPAGYLDVPYRSQWDSDSGDCKSTNCGPASVAMVLQYYNAINASTPISEVRRLAGCGGSCSNLCGFGHLESAAQSYSGCTAISRTDWNINQLRGKIAAGNPVIVLVHYGDLPRWDSFQGGHFFVVKGFTADGSSVIVHDPDYGANQYTRCQGADRVLPVDIFDTAWGDCARDGNLNRQVLVVTCCPADANGDRVVNALDLSILVGEWGRNCRQQPCRADLNSDGTVNAADLSIMVAPANYGRRCP